MSPVKELVADLALAQLRERELLERAFEIVRSAYSTHEWLQWSRSERTDETLEMLRARFGEAAHG